MQHKVDLISVGNGTASRETDKLAAELIAKMPDLKLTKVMVSEAGASVYSASELAAKEFPDLDVTLRGAVSIARRLQDPLAELVKIEPKAIGVGQYQHDVGPGAASPARSTPWSRTASTRSASTSTRRRRRCWRACPASTRRWPPTSSPSATRTAPSRRAPRSRRCRASAPKAFEQAAGFLRIMNGDNPLDASAVHPEAYPVVEKIAEATQAAAQVDRSATGRS